MGLAVYNSIILDLHFPSICYRKLLSPPVVPPLDSAPVGVTRDPTIDDLAEIMPVVSLSIHSRIALKFICEYMYLCEFVYLRKLIQCNLAGESKFMMYLKRRGYVFCHFTFYLYGVIVLICP